MAKPFHFSIVPFLYEPENVPTMEVLEALARVTIATALPKNWNNIEHAFDNARDELVAHGAEEMHPGVWHDLMQHLAEQQSMHGGSTSRRRAHIGDETTVNT